MYQRCRPLPMSVAAALLALAAVPTTATRGMVTFDSYRYKRVPKRKRKVWCDRCRDTGSVGNGVECPDCDPADSIEGAR
jgi:hypothetical protein